MQYLKEATAVDVLIGPFVDDTDGSTAEDGESPSVLLSKNGQALAAKNDATTPTHDDAGYYNCELDATDTGTIGTLVLVVEASANALPVRHEYQVIPSEIYDALFGSSANGFDASGRVDVGKWLGTAAATPSVAGVPEVDVTYVNGSAASGSGTPDVNVASISGDSTAANNLEAAFDGDGYAFTGCTLPQLKSMAPMLIGTVTGAGTGTEVFTYDSVTQTVTVDSSGNRSNVAET